MKKYNDLPKEILEEAINGNIESVEKIFLHYDKYITKLATKVNKTNNQRYLDEDLKQILNITILQCLRHFTSSLENKKEN